MNKLLLPANDIATTHALLRRATWGLWYRCERVCATTPALLRRATLMRRHLEGIDLATTHALLRRATVIDDFAVHSNAATTHALLRRTTTALLNAWRNNLCYNSRSPVENDGMCYTLMTRDNTRYNSRSLLRRATPLAVEPLDDALATTHALLRRAPIHHSFSSVSFVSYNSRSPAESDSVIFVRCRSPYSLQLTLSCGERLCLPAFTACSLVATTHALLRRATVILTEFVIDATSNCGN